MWSYAALFAHLHFKPRTELTGVEEYLLEKIETGDLTFFPVQRALTLRDADAGASTEPTPAEVQSEAALHSTTEHSEELKKVAKEVSGLRETLQKQDTSSSTTADAHGGRKEPTAAWSRKIEDQLSELAKRLDLLTAAVSNQQR